MKLQRRSRMGFSLVETIVGMLILALSVVGSFEALRLSDLKARHALIDNRITELLRESTDYVMYVAYDLLPPDGTVLSQGNLYRFYDSTAQILEEFLQLYRHRKRSGLERGNRVRDQEYHASLDLSG